LIRLYKLLNMKVRIIFVLICIACVSSIRYQEKIKNGPEPWTAKQLLQPADLAVMINHPKTKLPLIFCVGPGALIRGSIDTGPAHEKQNLEKLKLQLSSLPKDADIVIYCGCCPFERCPNIRPAFILLNEMKFSNARLLNLEHNIKTDWVSKGYPSVQ
jgi:thiosulfate/3-mercaptopyruvate sulfurtransferase